MKLQNRNYYEAFIHGGEDGWVKATRLHPSRRRLGREIQQLKNWHGKDVWIRTVTRTPEKALEILLEERFEDKELSKLEAEHEQSSTIYQHETSPRN